jgi:hypothetical protein
VPEEVDQCCELGLRRGRPEGADAAAGIGKEWWFAGVERGRWLGGEDRGHEQQAPPGRGDGVVSDHLGDAQHAVAPPYVGVHVGEQQAGAARGQLAGAVGGVGFEHESHRRPARSQRALPVTMKCFADRIQEPDGRALVCAGARLQGLGHTATAVRLPVARAARATKSTRTTPMERRLDGRFSSDDELWLRDIQALRRARNSRRRGGDGGLPRPARGPTGRTGIRGRHRQDRVAAPARRRSGRRHRAVTAHGRPDARETGRRQK